MSKIPFLEIIKEDFNVQMSSSELKSLIDEKRKKKKFFVKWLTENQFIISLNFSIGTNIFDTDYKSKSAICANVTICEIARKKTSVKVETKNKNGLLVILFFPIIIIILQLAFNLEIPLFSYFIPIIFFFFISSIFKSEEKRLIRYFKEYIFHRK